MRTDLEKVKAEREAFMRTLPILFFIFLGVLLYKGYEHSKHLAEFDVKCTEEGGVMHLSKSGRGLPEPECRNPNAFIYIE